MDKKMYIQFLQFLKERTESLEKRNDLTQDDVVSLEVELQRFLERFGKGEKLPQTIAEATLSLSLDFGPKELLNPPFWYKFLPRFFLEKDMRSRQIKEGLIAFGSDVSRLLTLANWFEKELAPLAGKENSFLK